MAYNLIADLGEYTSNLNINNKCNLLTLDNEVFLCEDILLEDYSANSTILTLSNNDMFPNNQLELPICIVNYRTNLLENSEHLDITKTPFTNSTAVATTPDYDGETLYYCNFNQNRAVIVDFPNLEVGKKYCFSYQCCRNPTNTTAVNQHQVTIDGNTYFQGRIEHGLWKTFKAVFTATSSSTSAEIILGFPTQTTNFGGYFRHFMLIEEDYDKWFDGTDIPFNEIVPFNINNDGSISLPNNYNKIKLCINGYVWHNNEKFYNHTIGNVNVIPSSPYQSRL